MKVKLFFMLTATMLFLVGSAQAQHSDVEFGYEYSTPGDTNSTRVGFEIEQDELTVDGFQFFEAEMEDPFNNGDFISDEPGFASNAAEALFINSGDQIFLNVLDASAHSSFASGFVNFYDPNTDSISAMGRLSISDNMGAMDLVLNGGSIESGAGPRFVDIGDGSNSVHDHLDFDLLDDATAPLGAYGLLVQLQADFGTADGTMDLSSDPFWLFYNHGMSEAEFDNNALRRFGVIPEPGSGSLLLLGAIGFCLRRRRA